MPNPYDLTTYDGNRVDELTKAALEATAARLGYDLTVTQGSYNAGGVAASAGTHDGGGAVDLAPYDAARKVLELRRTGFAAWHRTAIPGLWPEHVHAVLIGNARLSSGARAQVAEYLAGYDGLKGDGRDTGPRQFLGHRFKMPKAKPPRITDVTRARLLLEQAIAKTTRPARKSKLKAGLNALPTS